MPVRARAVLTEVQEFDGWWAKRDDLACYSGPEFPSGSKVRQYAEMSRRFPGKPMLVGCSADSAMSIYVAAAAYQTDVPGIIYTARRAIPSAAVSYAKGLGAEVVEVSPGYLSYIRKKAKERAGVLGGCVRWDPDWAVRDTAQQVQNLPDGVTRVVVPTGSGLIAAGVAAGLAKDGGGEVEVVAASVSGMATVESILSRAVEAAGGAVLPPISLVRLKGDYGKWKARVLPNGDLLDPYYAAKALGLVQAGDCLWLPGVRPLASLPEECLRELEKLGVNKKPR